MNYIGSKHKLTSFIKKSIQDTVGSSMPNLVFCDLFAGTGSVGKTFKPLVKQVIANDIEKYSYILNRNYIGNTQKLDLQDIFEELNKLEGIPGFIFENYCENGNENRLYFTEENGKKIDAIRTKIEELKQLKIINSDAYFHLLASLLESADKVANTASVYGAYLKKIKKSAQKKLILAPAKFTLSKNEHLVFNENSNQLISKIEGDILYLDPPYNERQYGANYHILNTIANYQKFVPKGKTGLPNYYKSKYCKKNEVAKEFDNLIKMAKFEYIFLSYNNEGIMQVNEVKKIMSQYGEYSLKKVEYQRFKADKTENRNHKANATIEYLHILKK